MLTLGDLAHLLLPHMPNWEQCFFQLPIVELCQKVGLILHGVGTRAKPLHLLLAPFPINLFYLRLCIVPCGDEVIFVSALAVESAELDQPIAHHVGIRRATGTHGLHRVASHLVPIVTMAVHDLQRHAKPMA